MSYVYKHTRVDKNEIFYIGIGTDKYFYRPKDNKRRNIYWKNIVNTTDWTYEVIFTHDDLDVVKKKEIELIEFYGRSVDGGTLCNITMGGEGTLGVSPVNIRSCYGISPEGDIFNFKSIMDAAKYVGDCRYASNIGSICKNIESGSLSGSRTCKGWKFAYDGCDIPVQSINLRGKIKNKPNSLSVKIWGKSPDGQVVEFINAYRAAEHIGSHHALVRKVCKGKSSHTKNWKFSYLPNL